MSGGYYVLRAVRAVVATRALFWRVIANRLAYRWKAWPPLL
jgi:hypothetical protein